MIYTFWEGKKPTYIDMCMSTWKLPFITLNYSNVNDYTNIPIKKIKRFTLPQIADIVRVHVLRDQGGYWLDADTIMLNDELPDTDMVGYPENRSNSIGLLHSEPMSDMFVEWAKWQDYVINNIVPMRWDVMGNMFTDLYVNEHPEVRIYPIEKFWPETYMIKSKIPRQKKYVRFYFEESHELSDIKPTGLLMLHNSWTPNWYKQMSKEEILQDDCTLSNILRSVAR